MNIFVFVSNKIHVAVLRSMVMPALVANTVTLEEVLEVRGGPLNEQELWSILTQACEALQDVFIKGT